MVAFDVFRLEDGKIAEHWDNFSLFADPNPSGRTQSDGPTEITDLDKTAANKDVVEAFISKVLIDGNFDVATEFANPVYMQHNPEVGDGLETLAAAIEAMSKVGQKMEYTKLHKVLGQGNFVLSMAEGFMGGKWTAYYDLFRLEEGKIVEHWDVISEIPEEQANDNGKF